MRLIHTTKLELAELTGHKTPPYAILSHTWESSEISYADFRAYTASDGVPGDSKIARCCVLAASEGWQYLWVDTCCIDKSSSAELTESINSMWNWYRNAAVCYVYLADISLKAANQNKPTKKFGSSRWFSRGWTLQELLAPEAVVFYDQDWFEIGSKASLKDNISKASNISPDYLFDAMGASVAAKMSWASNRTTTRIEDIAYCLLGLFDVNMPLLYGEGEKAFTRLQHEIIQSSPDQSIFAWKCPYQSWMDYCNLLAPAPVCFQDSGDIIPLAHGSLDRNAFLPRNYGLAVELHVAKMRHFSGCNHSCDQWVAPLACCRSSMGHAPLVLRFCEGKMDRLSLRSHVDKLDSLDCLEHHSDTYRFLPLTNETSDQPFEQKAFYFPMKSFPQLPPRMWLRAMNLGMGLQWISFTNAAVEEFTSTHQLAGSSTIFLWDINGLWNHENLTSLMPAQTEVRFRRGESVRNGEFVLKWEAPEPDEVGIQVHSAFLNTTSKLRNGSIVHLKYPSLQQSHTAKIEPNKFLKIRLRRGFHDGQHRIVTELDVTDLDRSKLL